MSATETPPVSIDILIRNQDDTTTLHRCPAGNVTINHSIDADGTHRYIITADASDTITINPTE